MNKKTGLFYNSEKKELFPMRLRLSETVSDRKTDLLTAAAESGFTLFD